MHFKNGYLWISVLKNAYHFLKHKNLSLLRVLKMCKKTDDLHNFFKILITHPHMRISSVILIYVFW